MVKQKVITRTRTIVKRTKAKSRDFFSGKNLQKQGIKAGLGIAGGLAASFILARLAPDFADEGGIIVSSLAGGPSGTIAWTLLGRRITEAVGGFTGAPTITGAGQQVGL